MWPATSGGRFPLYFYGTKVRKITEITKYFGDYFAKNCKIF